MWYVKMYFSEKDVYKRQGPHTVAVKDMVGISGDKYHLETGICRPEPPGSLHAVQLMKLHI